MLSFKAHATYRVTCQGEGMSPVGDVLVRKVCRCLQVSTEGPGDTAHPGSKFLLSLLEEEDERKDFSCRGLG